MARHNHIDTSPRFLTVNLERALLPGRFSCPVDGPVARSSFDARYGNHRSGASALPLGYGVFPAAAVS